MLAWLLCRQQPNNKMHLRIEDLETPRIKTCAISQIYDDFRWLGLTWDDAPNFADVIFQSRRVERYREVLTSLLERELVYPCTCSRTDIESAAAPHEQVLDGQVYSGACQANNAADCNRFREQGIRYSLRFRSTNAMREWLDAYYGPQALNVANQLGDFVVWRNDDQPAYQLAVVIDDHDMSINQVVRGGDLIYSTFRQLELYDAMQWQPPEFVHLPLVVGTDGRRLAKRHGDTRISTMRERGVTANQLLGYLAWKSGLIQRPKQCSLFELLTTSPLANLPKSPLVFELESELSLIKSIA
jgi:glutamyl-tRNA synthetase